MRVPLKTLALLLAGPVCAPAIAACHLGLGDPIKHVQLKEDSRFAALLHLGYEYGVCLGIENPGLGLLKGASETDLSNATVAEIVRHILGPESYRLQEQAGVVLIRNPEALRRDSQLDVVLPEFTIPRMPVAWANEALSTRLALVLDPSQGVAGRVSDGLPNEKTGPFSEDGRTVREILTSIVGGSNGGAWVSGRCPDKHRRSIRACWTVFQYQLDRQSFDGRLSWVSDRSIREETGQRQAIP